MVSRLVMVLGSPDVALDVKHTPALYSRFLASLMVDHSLVSNNADMPSYRCHGSSNDYPGDRHSTPSDGFPWPDVPNSNKPSEEDFSCQPSGCESQAHHEIPLDFSLSNFMRAIAEQTPLEEVERSEPWQFNVTSEPPVQPHSWTEDMPPWIGN